MQIIQQSRGDRTRAHILQAEDVTRFIFIIVINSLSSKYLVTTTIIIIINVKVEHNSSNINNVDWNI